MLSTPLRAAAGRTIGLIFLLSGVVSPAAAAPKYLGPNKCISCHDHDKQKDWSAKDAHAKALAQLEDRNAAKYAKAIGLADPYNLKGACVACHATVFNGDANAGVSCETCHGAGSDYVEPHQQKGSYAKAVTLGMIDTRGNYAVWAKMCNECHILRDQKLIAAGHKSGADFEVGAGSKKIVHWGPAYDFAQISAAGKASAGKRPAPAPAAPAKEEAKPTPPPARPSPSPKPTAAPAPPTAPAPRGEAAAPTAPAAKKPTRPEPTEAPARVSTAAPTPVPTAVRIPATAPPPPRTAPPPTPTSRAVTAPVVIEIAVTPIPKATALPRLTAAAPSAPLETTMGAAPPPQATKRPAAKPKPKPKSKQKPKPETTPAPPALTRTPTKLPAPIEPPRRPPH